ncbi:four-carbon acid sugar kinase family protein [Negadavirga shengliensis]|uniref:Four-carbon acid sugar kinase family protein n=1 Tax=Negadavirga shengliensis TaxID=1389218 RepID=A0ABV9T5W5_9BACT
MEVKTNSSLLLAYYGDDFTGSTDALEVISRYHLKAVLFISPPSREQLDKYPGIQAYGVAGMSRAMDPEEMEKELKPAFRALKTSGASQVHYKVCSTFDSAPHIGSIGKAIDIGKEVFGSRYISLLVAAPALGRYGVFGNLFARVGTGKEGPVYRLDRHPSMSRHPITPMGESDLRLHLKKQTDARIGLVDILAAEEGVDQINLQLERNLADQAEVVLFDALDTQHMESVGAIMDAASEGEVHFSVGSSGVEMALGQYWNKTGKTNPNGHRWPDPGKSTPLLVVSGSCSPVTEAQINWAFRHDFESVALDTLEVVRGDAENEIQRCLQLTAAQLLKGRSVVIHAAIGRDDPRLVETKQQLAASDKKDSEVTSLTSVLLGKALGKITKGLAEKNLFKRLVIAGGDTSSIMARTLGIEAVEMIASIVPGAPLCKALAPNSPLDGLEINFKGGQVGGDDYFGRLLEGK